MKFANKILPFLVVAMLFALPGFAQTGNISGKVVDTEGKPATGLTISIDRQGITQHFEVKTDGKGQYLHAGLPTGQYKVSVIKDGKTLTSNPSVRVTFGGDTKTDFDLKQAAAQGASEEERAKIAEEKAKQEAVKNSFELARTAMTAKNYDEAIRLFKEAAEKDATQHVIFANLADALSSAKNAKCPPTTGLDPQPRPHDAALGRVGGTGTRRASRCTPSLLCQDRRLDPVPVLPACR